MKKTLFFLGFVGMATLGMAQNQVNEDSPQSNSNSMHMRIRKQHLTQEEVAKKREDRQKEEVDDASHSGMQMNRSTVRHHPETERPRAIRKHTQETNTTDSSNSPLKMNRRILDRMD